MCDSGGFCNEHTGLSWCWEQIGRGRQAQQFIAKVCLIWGKATVRRLSHLRDIDCMQLLNMLGAYRYDIQVLYLSQYPILCSRHAWRNYSTA